MKPLARHALLTRRSLGFALGTLSLLGLLFVLGYPRNTSEQARYLAALRELRTANLQLDDDILGTRLGLEDDHGSWSGRFIALHAKAQALRSFPGFLGPDARQALSVELDTYVHLLRQQEALLARLQQEGLHAAEPRQRFMQQASALAARLGPAAPQATLEALANAVWVGGEAGTDTSRLFAEQLEALARTPVVPELEGLRAQVLQAAREAIAHHEGAHAALRTLLQHPAAGTSQRLVSLYLEQYQQELERAASAHRWVFTVSLLLVGFVTVVLLRLERTGQQLNLLNHELEQRVAERTSALSVANERLRNTAARKAAILEGSLDCIITLDQEGHILEFNPAAEQTFRLPGAEALGRDFRRLAFPGLAPSAALEVVESALRPAAEPGRATRLELSARRADGASFPAELTIFQVRGDGPPCFSIYLRDISERREVERMKNEFISTVSHELRTPLTAIRGSLGLMENGIVGSLPAPVLDMVRIARSNTERLIRLINDILDLEKIESGKLELKLQPLEVSELIDATFSGLRSVADGAEVTLRSSTAGAGPVRADRDRLIQVLTNLVSNAIKFSPRRGVVKVSAVRDARGAVRFSISDHGPGISLDQRSKLFGKFQQLDGSDTRSKGGTGLGLAISQSIVEQHGGHIEVHSQPGHGATFTFALPSVSMDSASMAVIRDESRHTVLIVTGDDALFALMRGLLRMEGYRVLRTASAQEAWRMIEAGAPEALVLDTELPEGSGLELMMRLRAAPQTHRLPIIIVSGHPPESVGMEATLEADWLVKPFDETRFLHALRFSLRQPGRARVLVVEDDSGMRQAISDMLEELGMQCYTASNGESAVAMARERPPDLIILDVGLPRMDGFEVVDMLRQGKSRTTPLIVFTGQELSPDDRRQLTLGTTCYLTKPQAGAELVERVKELLGGILAGADRKLEFGKVLP